MKLSTYQYRAMNGLFMDDEQFDKVSHLALGLVGEAGEVADQVKKGQYVGQELDRKRVVEELGDVLWYLAVLAGQLGFTVEELASLNMKKLHERHPHLYPEVLE